MYDVGTDGGAVQMLGDLGLPEDLIEQVRSMLGYNAHDLEKNNVGPIDQGLFGSSSTGANLGHHASLAQQHVAKAVLQMAAGLRGYRDNLADFVDDLGDTDAASATALNGLASSTACVAAPNFETNNACTLPLSTGVSEMARGPQRARLDHALLGAQDDVVDTHATEWEKCQGILQQIASALATASPEVKAKIGGKTGPAVDEAFNRSAKRMGDKAAELTEGAAALRNAAGVIRTAKVEQDDLNRHPLTEPPPYNAPVGPPTRADIQAESQNRQAHSEYNAAYADQEARAKKHADAMDRVFRDSTATMKKIHGEPDPQPKPSTSGGVGGSSGGTGGSGGSVPSGSGGGPRNVDGPRPGNPGPGHPGPRSTGTRDRATSPPTRARTRDPRAPAPRRAADRSTRSASPPRAAPRAAWSARPARPAGSRPAPASASRVRRPAVRRAACSAPA